MKVKGVIVAAGYGTRFLPVTKTVPKELLPLMDRPAIDFIVDEFVQAGLDEILIISSRRKKALDDYFDREYELESELTKSNALSKLAKLPNPPAEIMTVRQREMNGTGNALLLARPFVGNHPFVVAYPDDIFTGGSLTSELVALHQKTGGSVLAVRDCSGMDVSRFGVVAVREKQGRQQVSDFVEKPPIGQEPSHLVSVGRYLFEPSFFDWLEEGKKSHRGGEYYHLYAMKKAIVAKRLWAHCTTLRHLDVGEPLGYLEAFCRYALSQPEWQEPARQLFETLSK
ncbi:MAG: UTP--glucose-1-phosphate uridylyltransferase [Acidobacteria bacterium]|nr:UTP--glucose-1-phosphate uridylyltransferase [Acidobacteriota bacterium]MCB9397400.1 UTP--glucose-1-phosphate uridylyltransferase [Acidobacteriota bacterium]